MHSNAGGATTRPGDREFEVVVHGATGFVGRLVAGHLARSAPPGTRVALSGRSADRLAAVRAGLGAVAADWPLLTADSADATALAAVVRRARVVASTVGPYAVHGLPLVGACATAGTDYVDLTGEVTFVRRSIDAADATAVATGARIVHACGFDSVPSDLGVLLLHRAATADGADDGTGLTETALTLVAARGGLSGGTTASLLGQLESARVDPEVRALLRDPYSLSPDRAAEPDLGPEPDDAGVRFAATPGGWVGPYVMARFNTRVVRRSNALSGYAYGRGFRYQEQIEFGTGRIAAVTARAATGAVRGATIALGAGPVRALLHRVLPGGSGPGERTRAAGYFRLTVHTRTTAGRELTATVAAKGDPGYAATSVMIGEAALALALDRDRLPDRAGVLTPATGIGDVLVDRLRTAGMTLTVS